MVPGCPGDQLAVDKLDRIICTSRAFGTASSHLLCCSGACIGPCVNWTQPSSSTDTAAVRLAVDLASLHVLCLLVLLSLSLSPLVIWFSDWHSTVVVKGLSSAVQLEGLPQSALELAAQQAKDEGETEATAEKGPWLFTLDFPSFFPVITHSKNRWELVLQAAAAVAGMVTDNHGHRQPWSQTTMVTDNHGHRQP